MQILNRQETEDLIIDLYHNQKMTFREIQKIVRKSPRDIKAIIDKVNNPDKSSSLSESSRAYQMFMKGGTPAQVAIAGSEGRHLASCRNIQTNESCCNKRSSCN